jgi:DNA-binding transcriptional ArsR family regulator
MTTKSEKTNKIFTALADPTRRRLLSLIAEKGQATATTLSNEVTVSRQAVVKHLIFLKEADLVSNNRQGREMRYTVRPQQLDETAKWMANLAKDWDRKLEAIKLQAESAESD